MDNLSGADILQEEMPHAVKQMSLLSIGAEELLSIACRTNEALFLPH
jgi:hypothetical protein